MYVLYRRIGHADCICRGVVWFCHVHNGHGRYIKKVGKKTRPKVRDFEATSTVKFTSGVPNLQHATPVMYDDAYLGRSEVSKQAHGALFTPVKLQSWQDLAAA
jgi:hypothetical protein